MPLTSHCWYSLWISDNQIIKLCQSGVSFMKVIVSEVRYFVFSWQFLFTRFFRACLRSSSVISLHSCSISAFLTNSFNPRSLSVMSFTIRPYIFPKRTYLFLRWCFIYFDLWFTNISIELSQIVFKSVVIFVETRSFLMLS